MRVISLKFHTTTIVVVTLMVVMAATRSHHFSTLLHLPDATLAVFFVAGFLSSNILLLPVLLLEAGLIDYLSITLGNSSDWCVTPAYMMLAPTYACLWLAGRWYVSRHEMVWRRIPLLLSVLLISTSLAFLISNASFYAMSGKFGELNWLEYSSRVAKYYLPYIYGTYFYGLIFSIVYVVHWCLIERDWRSIRT